MSQFCTPTPAAWARRTLSAAAALAAFADAAAAQSGTYNGHTYLLTSTASTWLDARAAAAALGGHLVTITSAGENQFLVNTFFPTGGVAYWMGLRRVGAPSTSFSTPTASCGTAGRR